MIDFKESYEKKLSKDFKQKGYLIFNTDDTASLIYLRDKIVSSIERTCNLNHKKNKSKEEFLNTFHKKIKKHNLNNHRLKIINLINKDRKFKKKKSFKFKDKKSFKKKGKFSKRRRDFRN